MTDLLSHDEILRRKAWSSINSMIDWNKFWSTPIKRTEKETKGYAKEYTIDPPARALETLMENYFPLGLAGPEPEEHIIGAYEWQTGNTDIFKPNYASCRK